MQKQVIYRDRQEFQAADPNNAQAYTRATFGDLVTDAITDTPQYAGFVVSQKNATEVTVAAGRLYSAGSIYASNGSTDKSLFSTLPLATKKIVAITVWGQAVETDAEPRDFLVDLTSGETEPQAVAMTRSYQAVVDYVAGLESASPQPPEIAGAQVAVAYVTLTTTGIESVEMLTENRVAQGRALHTRLSAVERWRDGAEPRIQSIATDLAALGARTNGLADHNTVINIASDLADMRQQMQLPTGVSNWDADNFIDASKSDDTGNGYTCIVDAGLRPGHAGSAQQPLALLNPSDPAVKKSGANLILPRYSHSERLRTTGYAGSVGMNLYPAYNWTWYRYTYYPWRYHWGWAWAYNSHYWYTSYYAWAGYYGYQWVVTYNRGYRRWVRRWVPLYAPGVVPASQTGSMVAQTVLISNAMWLTKIGLYFDAVAPGAGCTVLVVETAAGKPDLGKVLTSTTVSAADLLVRSAGETGIEVEPTHLEAGKRYAFVIVSSAAHRLAVVHGSQYTQGTLFFGTDGEYLAGDLSKDLMFTLYGAEFENVRAEIPMEPVELAGGMTDIDMELEQIVPDGTELTWEVLINGAWRDLDAAGDVISATKPSLVQLRGVCTGTRDMMPAFRLNASGLTSSRPAASLVHWSQERTLDTASDSIQVRLLIDGYDPEDHAITVVLFDPATGTTYSADSVRVFPEAEATRMIVEFTPEDGAGITTYQVRIGATLAGLVRPFTILERTDVAI